MPDDLSKPSKQTHVPVVPSHVPWPEHVPSPGQSNTDNMNRRIPQLVFCNQIQDFTEHLYKS